MNRGTIATALSVCLAALSSAQAQETAADFGVLIMAGGRYDNLRMCVASPAGVKGGPVGDIMLTTRFALSDKSAFGVDIPVMRPLLFGLAFQMLQFEPQFAFDWRVVRSRNDIVLSPTLGASFHYGPDYRSDSDNRGEDFFAAGPIAGFRAGLGFKGEDGNVRTVIGLRPFYAALFSSDRGTGTVLGASLEFLRTF